MAEQIDKLSKKLVKLTQTCKAFAKKQKRKERRRFKDEELTPPEGRYNGWIA